MNQSSSTATAGNDDIGIQVSRAARDYLMKLLDGQGGDLAGIRMTAIASGTLQADCRLEFCEPADLDGNELSLDFDGLKLLVDGASVTALVGAEIDYTEERTGGQLSIRAPALKPSKPGDDAPLETRVQWLLDTEINPQLASHGGRVALVSVEQGMVELRFGGGCHGCGMVDVTLRNGIEKTLREKIPEIAGVRDATDHSTGQNPYVR